MVRINQVSGLPSFKGTVKFYRTIRPGAIGGGTGEIKYEKTVKTSKKQDQEIIQAAAQLGMDGARLEDGSPLSKLNYCLQGIIPGFEGLAPLNSEKHSHPSEGRLSFYDYGIIDCVPGMLSKDIDIEISDLPTKTIFATSA